MLTKADNLILILSPSRWFVKVDIRPKWGYYKCNYVGKEVSPWNLAAVAIYRAEVACPRRFRRDADPYIAS